jgi:hypothetical protein
MHIEQALKARLNNVGARKLGAAPCQTPGLIRALSAYGHLYSLLGRCPRLEFEIAFSALNTYQAFGFIRRAGGPPAESGSPRDESVRLADKMPDFRLIRLRRRGERCWLLAVHPHLDES